MELKKRERFASKKEDKSLVRFFLSMFLFSK